MKASAKSGEKTISIAAALSCAYVRLHPLRAFPLSQQLPGFAQALEGADAFFEINAYNPVRLELNCLPREVNSKDERGFETMWTSRRLFAQVD